ncbi:ChaB family protein [Pseudonocardia abyssalis]|uniref:ChaB family protein n=1 Tax=Pseudonocardia abyssalis TaxID=2792008 RepID=A0ABS6UP94_9PSEU|nr:ChaB family protein [Pseudonocardia abyssalis]MBW0115374.1 ChaB family protein [Pseudonocardia abyssalis]MBW0134076.1 ChaB family protein [Pseudonocardia abyssalis]
MPAEEDVPSTVERSAVKAQRTWEKTFDSALQTYDGDGGRARRAAFASLKHTHEKVGDHWEPKDGNGPSDEQAERGSVDTDLPTAGGVDANATKEHLLGLARRLGVEGRSSMTKAELVDALQRASDRETARARRD